MSSEATAILKPVVCDVCKARFADNYCLDQHKAVHVAATPRAGELIPRSMTIEELKNHLRARGLSVSGRKDVLVRRLEGRISAGETR